MSNLAAKAVVQSIPGLVLGMLKLMSSFEASAQAPRIDPYTLPLCAELKAQPRLVHIAQRKGLVRLGAPTPGGTPRGRLTPWGREIARVL